MADYYIPCNYLTWGMSNDLDRMEAAQGLLLHAARHIAVGSSWLTAGELEAIDLIDEIHQSLLKEISELEEQLTH